MRQLAVSTSDNAGRTQWVDAVDQDGRVYYWNPLTQETTWTMPEGFVVSSEPPVVHTHDNEGKHDDSVSTALPDGWVELFDETNQTAYYYNQTTGQSVWERPTS
jgi:hypothetical protein